MSVKRRLLNMFMALVMLSSLASVGAIPERLLPDSGAQQVAQAAALGSVKVGDYIQFGSYNNAPILWRVIHIGVNGDPILFADRILTIKAFDAAGSYHTGNSDRVSGGSNYYLDSNIRQWLNSSSSNSGGNTINWIQNDPSTGNLFNNHNPYDSEKGFLADGNFSATERSLIKPLTHKVLLAGVDQTKKDGGTTEHDYYGDTNLANVIQNYDTTAYFKNVTDSVFQLSIKQLKEWVYDRGYTVPAKPTEEAVTQSTYKASWLNSSSNYEYWLNSPDAAISEFVRTVGNDGGVGNGTAYSGLIGVRPAVQLDLPSVNFAVGGTGTSSSPYVVTTEALDKPVYQSLVLSSDAKQLTATFDSSLSSSDSTKITIKNGTSTALSNTAFNTSVSQKSLVITLADSKATFKAGAKITIGAGAVTASTGGKNDAVSEITLDTTKFVKFSAATMNSNNTEATLTFATTGKSGSLGSIALNPALANLSGQVEASEDGGKSWSANTVDSAALVGNTVKVNFNSAVSNSKTTLRVKAGALSFTATGKDNGNLNSNVSSAALDLFPVGVSTSLSIDNKVVTIKYSESITNAVDTAKGSITELKKKISFAADGIAFSPVGANVSNVVVAKDTVIITFVEGLNDDLNKVKIDADALQDARKNKAGVFTTEAIVADEINPYVTGVGFKASDKTITVFFNENILLNEGTTLTSLASALKYNTSSSFSNAMVTISKNTLMIKHNTSGISSSGNGGVSNVVIPKELLRDAAANENDDIQTSAADVAAPVVKSHVLSNGGKNITIKFDENVYSVAKSVALGSITITTGSGQSAVTKPIADVIWRTPTTTVTIADDTVIISNLKVALTNGNVVTIKTGTIQDGQLNKQVIAATTTVDTTAPMLTSLTASAITSTGATFNFQSNEEGTYLYVGYTEESTPVTAPTASQIYSLVQSGLVDYLGAEVMTTTGAQSAELPYLTAETTYNFYVVLLDNGNNYSNVATVNFTTASP